MLHEDFILETNRRLGLVSASVAAGSDASISADLIALADWIDVWREWTETDTPDGRIVVLERAGL